jgi:hypothetical protein
VYYRTKKGKWSVREYDIPLGGEWSPIPYYPHDRPRKIKVGMASVTLLRNGKVEKSQVLQYTGAQSQRLLDGCTLETDTMQRQWRVLTDGETECP